MTGRKLPFRHQKKKVKKILHLRSGRSKNNSRSAAKSLKGYLKSITFFIFSITLVAILLGVGYFVSKRKWDGKGQIIIAFQTIGQYRNAKDVFVFSLVPEENALKVLRFTDNMVVDTVSQDSKWRVESIYPLGELRGNGGRLLSKSLSLYLGIKIDGWFIRETERTMDVETFKDHIVKDLTMSLIGGGDTDLPVWDRIRLIFDIRAVQMNNLQWIDLSQAKVLITQKQPDASILLVAEPELLDNIVTELFSDRKLLQEGIPVVIINSTEHQGLGRKGARIARNMGVNVVAVKDNPIQTGESTLSVNSSGLLDSYTTKMIAEIFGLDLIKVEDTTPYRGDLLIVLGEDYWKDITNL